MKWLTANDAKRAWLFCLGMISLPADDAMEAQISIVSNGRLGARSHLRNSLGREPSRFVSSLEYLPWSSGTSRRDPELYKPPSPEVSQALLRSSTQPVAIWRQFPSQASNYFSLTARKLEVLATPSLLRSLSQNCSKAAEAPPRRCPWAHIARVQVGARSREPRALFLPRQLLPCAKGTAGSGWHNQFLDPLYETPYKLNSVLESRCSTVNGTFSLSEY